MARDVFEDYYIRPGSKIPVKWTAPEVDDQLSLIKYTHNVRIQALYFHKYSVQSDVWSFACVLYEVWSIGHRPFERISITEVVCCLVYLLL